MSFIQPLLLSLIARYFQKGPFYETRTWGLRRGILLTDEHFYNVQRRFIVRHLKEFGFARKGMAEIIQNEAEYCLNDFLKLIENNGGKGVLLPMQKVHIF